MKIRAVGAGLLLVAAGAAPALASDTTRPMCHLNDGGDWTYVTDHYDDARDGGHGMDRMADSAGTCTWPAVVAPKPEVRTLTVTKTRTVVRTKVVTKKIVIRNGKRTVTRKVAWR